MTRPTIHTPWPAEEVTVPYPTTRQVIERFGLGYRGKHRVPCTAANMLRSPTSYVPERYKPEDEWSS